MRALDTVELVPPALGQDGAVQALHQLDEPVHLGAQLYVAALVAQVRVGGEPHAAEEDEQSGGDGADARAGTDRREEGEAGEHDRHAGHGRHGGNVGKDSPDSIRQRRPDHDAGYSITTLDF